MLLSGSLLLRLWRPAGSPGDLAVRHFCPLTPLVTTVGLLVSPEPPFV
jgi:hypothetical protein